MFRKIILIIVCIFGLLIPNKPNYYCIVFHCVSISHIFSPFYCWGIGAVSSLEMLWTYFICLLKKHFIYLFLEVGGKREKERERNIDVWKETSIVASRTPPSGNLAPNPGMCPDPDLNWQPFGLQAGAQSTEPHQPGPCSICLLWIHGYISIGYIFRSWIAGSWSIQVIRFRWQMLPSNFARWLN